jgi:hypothetical protein
MHGAAHTAKAPPSNAFEPRRRAADGSRAGAEQDEDDGEAEDERQARPDDALPHPTLAEAVDLDGRDRGEVARDERQHARRDHRQQPGEERDRDLLNHRSA